MTALLSALVLTLVLEGCFIFAVTRSRDWLAVSAAGNLITNPILNVLNALLGGAVPLLLRLELGAVIAEALLYYFVLKPSIVKAFGLSLCANLISFLLGSALLAALWR